MRTRIRSMLSRQGATGPWIVVSAVLVALLVTPLAIAQTANNGKTVRGGARNPSDDQRQAFTQETQIIANTSTYGTRQSNKSDNGGGAIYGCRSGAGGTAAGNEPCIRAQDLSTGLAFEFVTAGNTGGRIETHDPSGKPFTTNATGVADGLNADRVDGQNADDIVAAAQGKNLFAAVGSDGTLAAGRGAASAARTSDGNYTVRFTPDVSKCAYQATETTIADAGAVAVQAQDANTILVRTRKGGGADGTGPSDPADRPFHLVAIC